MKKLYWLNAMIRFFWMISLITIPIAFIGMIGVFFIGEMSDTGIDITMNGNNFVLTDLSSQIYFSLNCFVYLMMMYVVYLFKKMITIFLKAQIFDDAIVVLFHKIGMVLLGSGLLMVISTYLIKVFQDHTVHLEIGISQNVLMVFMGLFFMVLSEIFKISKNIKLENDLTI